MYTLKHFWKLSLERRRKKQKQDRLIAWIKQQRRMKREPANRIAAR